MSGFVSVLLAILLLGILIVIHEAGHFWAARLTGIEVREFAVGFGPQLLGWTSKKHGTHFALRLIPLGGYCAFYGEDDAEGTEQDDPRAFPKQKVWKRILTVLMGPGMNFVLALVVMIAFYLFTGVGVYDPYLSQIEESGPMAQTEAQAGDIIQYVNGEDVRNGSYELASQAISGWQEGDEPLQITLERRTEEGPQTVTVSVTPVWDEEAGRYRVGIYLGLYLRQSWNGTAWETDLRSCGFGEAVRDGWDMCVYAGSTILNALKQLVTTGEGLEDTSGPVGVVSMVSSEVQQGGLEAFLWMLVVISINLGIMNLLPIPGLDGSRFLFLLLEAIRRKPVPQRKEAMVHLVGMAFLFAVMIFFTFKDVIRLFQ